MIDINLVPDHLRKKSKGKLLQGTQNVPPEIIIGIGGGLIVLLIIFHVFLLATNIYKIVQYKSLQQQWTKILPDKEKADKIINDMRSYQARFSSVDNMTKGKRIFWSEKLNIISDNLSKGIWLNKIDFDEDILLISGRALSRRNEQMLNVHTFAGILKANKDFLTHFEDLELGSMQLEKIGETEIASFLITCHLKK